MTTLNPLPAMASKCLLLIVDAEQRGFLVGTKMLAWAIGSNVTSVANTANELKAFGLIRDESQGGRLVYRPCCEFIPAAKLRGGCSHD